MNESQNLYFMVVCQSRFDENPAVLTYHPDTLIDGNLRSWKSGKKFTESPPVPIAVTIDAGESGVLLEVYDATIALLSRRLANVLTLSGVSNVDVYDVVINDLESGQRYESHVAFNIRSILSVAGLEKSSFHAPIGSLTSVDFDSLTLDENRANGTRFFAWRNL